MLASDSIDMLRAAGLDESTATRLIDTVERSQSPEAAWWQVAAGILTPKVPFAAHQAAHRLIFSGTTPPLPVWIPDPATIERSNLRAMMRDRGIETYEALHRWSVEHRFDFWQAMIERLGIQFMTFPTSIVSDEQQIETPQWLPGAKLNIADSCLGGSPEDVAIIHGGENGAMRTITVRELEALTNRVANGLVAIGIQPGDAVAIDMPMTAESVIVYLGVVRAGAAVVSIADSFAANEIATRLRIAGARLIFTQDVIHRGGKTLPLYERVVEAEGPRAVVLAAGESISLALRDGDIEWTRFLSDSAQFDSVSREPDHNSNILFSSGTTGDPKAIPWTHTTPIKCAADAWLHHDVHRGDVLAWPTNLGWMMGPWLIYAALVNRATIALYNGAPTTRGFCAFVQDAKVTMLGVVPSIVKAWRASDATNGLDWSAIRAFSSTGECSNAEDMFWLMSRAGYKPVIEYCGGTEIGGGYITGTVIQPACAAMFSTPAMGLDVAILDEHGSPAQTGELFIVPPSIGLSNTLLNRDHQEVYYADTPRGPSGELLRRHGDEMRRLDRGYYQALGRADDTMNLGGIKVSSAEIERVLNELPEVVESAAIAVPPPGGGPDRLILFAVLRDDALGIETLRRAMQDRIRQRLNPLFRVAEVRAIAHLPRTASNKVMRRVLRAQCMPDTAQTGV